RMDPFCNSLSENHVYHLINKTKSWSDAQQYCRKYYTDLATVNDMTDQERLKEAAEGKQVWIGLYQMSDKQREWHWSQPGVKYNKSDTKWKTGEPSDNGTKTSNPTHFIKTEANPEMNWFQAQHFCREKHTDLISGVDQLNMYNDKEPNKPDKDCFIGLFRDNWGWSDGSDSSFRNWNKDVNPSDNKCAKLEEDGGWDSDKCSNTKPFICYDGECLKNRTIKKNMTWEDAMDYCRHRHRDLAWFNAPNLQRMVEKRAKMADSEVVWVGLHYTCFLEEWLWVNGHYVSEHDHNWENPRYNDCGLNGAMERGGSNKWVKRSSWEKHNFICAKHC
uniref:C-type lectin domain-containing protein n=1 Tax=Neogobius melanostomus TaxID=47308 RepID=A0A8C6SUY6_9GOBI